ncbi:hypothetical protein [Arcanobacterium pinnipediorum]|uniref:Uncharacterized protein n=1 Tax=Arcanobacterium pinnipediorum TaxID=1503041 RepID=A0ABY5AHP9_9ACTO|nr:hypothetical protein [Arcanobacterium pinnipediorum]USR79241.1 hypothetical protein NG665_07635 [Arcanobacterium pinnipediorum]
MTGNKKSRRVVRLSRVDAQRLANGEITTPEEAVHISDARTILPKVEPIQVRTGQALDAHERQLLENIPPHFGKL